MRDKIRDLVIEAIVDSSKLTEVIEKLYVLVDDYDNGWEMINTLPKVDGFYLVYSVEKNIWTKAFFKMGEFHTIESDIDGYITHWKPFIKPLPF